MYSQLEENIPNVFIIDAEMTRQKLLWRLLRHKSTPGTAEDNSRDDEQSGDHLVGAGGGRSSPDHQQT